MFSKQICLRGRLSHSQHHFSRYSLLAVIKAGDNKWLLLSTRTRMLIHWATQTHSFWTRILSDQNRTLPVRGISHWSELVLTTLRRTNIPRHYTLLVQHWEVHLTSPWARPAPNATQMHAGCSNPGPAAGVASRHQTASPFPPPTNRRCANSGEGMHVHTPAGFMACTYISGSSHMMEAAYSSFFAQATSWSEKGAETQPDYLFTFWN